MADICESGPAKREAFPIGSLKNGWISASDGSLHTSEAGPGGFTHHAAIGVIPGKRIRMKNKNDITKTNAIVFFDANQTYIAGIEHAGIIDEFVPAGAKTALINLVKADLNDYSCLLYDGEEKPGCRLIQDTPGVKLIAHRGYNGIAPEATIPAYELAGQHGFWGCKVDVCETSDGYFVCSHDDSVDRMFDGSGKIRDLSLAEIQVMTVDNGANIEQYPNQRIVMFETALSICKKYGMHAYIEMKRLLSDASVLRVLNILNECGLIETCLFQCSDRAVSHLVHVRYFQDDALPPLVLWRRTFNLERDLPLIKTLKNAALSLNCFAGHEEVQFETYVNDLKATGLPICTAVCNNIDYAKKWIKEYDLDLMVTAGITYRHLTDT